MPGAVTRPSAVAPDTDSLSGLAGVLTGSLAADPRVVGAAVVESEMSGEPLLEVLTRWGTLDEEQAVIALALQHRLSIMDLARRRVDHEAAVLLSAAHCRRLACVAVDRRGDVLHVATSRPTGSLVTELERLTGHPVQLWLAEPSVVRAAIESIHAPARSWTFSSIGDPLHLLLEESRRLRAAAVRVDLVGAGSGRISFEVDGVWRASADLPLTFARDLAAVLDAQTSVPRAGFGVVTIATASGDPVSVAITATSGRRHVVIETPAQVGRSLVSLGIPSGGAAALRHQLACDSGLLLVTGPVGSGLSTTLGSLLAKLDARSRIVTLVGPSTAAVPDGVLHLPARGEDEVLAAIEHARSTGATVVVLADLATAAVARAALLLVAEGRLVIGALRAAATHADRDLLARFGIAAHELPAQGLVVVGQRLLRRTCTSCARAFVPGAAELDAWSALGGDPTLTFSRGVGCDVCDHTGHLERTAVVEVLASASGTSELVRCTHSLEQSAIDLVQRQVISVTEMVRAFAPVTSTTAP
jgi:ABC-type hemin transport system ATPase subunit